MFQSRQSGELNIDRRRTLTRDFVGRCRRIGQHCLVRGDPTIHRQLSVHRTYCNGQSCHVGFGGCGRRAGRTAASRLWRERPYRMGVERSRQAHFCPFKVRRRVPWSLARAACHLPPSARHRCWAAGRLFRDLCHALSRLRGNPSGAAGRRNTRSAGAVGADGRGWCPWHGIR